MIRIVGRMAAILAGILLVTGVEFFSAIVHPFPADFDGSPEAVCLHVTRYPSWVLAVVVFLWAGTAFGSTWVSGRIGKLFSGLITGLLLMAALIFNGSMLPYPLWFKIVILLTVTIAIGSACPWPRQSRPGFLEIPLINPIISSWTVFFFPGFQLLTMDPSWISYLSGWIPLSRK